SSDYIDADFNTFYDREIKYSKYLKVTGYSGTGDLNSIFFSKLVNKDKQTNGIEIPSKMKDHHDNCLVVTMIMEDFIHPVYFVINTNDSFQFLDYFNSNFYMDGVSTMNSNNRVINMQVFKNSDLIGRYMDQLKAPSELYDSEYFKTKLIK